MGDTLNTVKSRDSLKPRHAPYWHKISTGCFLGFRKITSDTTGVWLARYRNEETGAQKVHSLGRFEEFQPANRYDEASKAASTWLVHMGRGGSGGTVTVRSACENYLKYLREEKRKTAAAADAEGRFKRWVYPNVKLSRTSLQKLTAREVGSWRTTVANTKVIPQDKKKPAVKDRSSSALNRDMATLKAALNLALSNGDCTSDQAWKLKLKPVKDATGRRDVYLDVKQRLKLIERAPEDLAALLRALSLVPMRPGAVAALTAGNFDKRLGVLTVGKDKSGRDRKISLPKETAAFFAEQSRDKLPGAPLLARANGQFWNKDSWKYPFKDAAKAAKLPAEATAYALRHSTITDLIALHRLDTMTVAQLSGTSLAMIEKHYGHLLRDHAANALALLAL